MLDFLNSAYEILHLWGYYDGITDAIVVKRGHIGNVATQATQGNINNAGDFFKAYGQGALVGAALGSAWYFSGPADLAGMDGLLGPMEYFLKVAGEIIHTSMSAYGIAQTGVGVVGMIGGAINDSWDGLGRARKLFLGNFNLDENSFVGGKSSRKMLRMFYSARELSGMMDISYQTLHEELRRNEALSLRLSSMGRHRYGRFSKSQVLEIFRTLGFPHGYEHYE